MSDALFYQFVLLPNYGVNLAGRLNIEAVELAPLFTATDDFFLLTLGGIIDSRTGLIGDPTPPFGLYPSNFNQITPFGNSFEPAAYEERWYESEAPGKSDHGGSKP